MELTIIGPVLISLVFGLVVALVEQLIAHSVLLPASGWLARAWAYMCFCYIILFGVIHL